MNENIGEKNHSSHFEGCSPFFLTSSFLSLYNGWKNRKNSIKNAYSDEEFQKELQRQKEIYEDQKEAEEWAFKFWLRRKQREFAREENSRRLDNDLQKADLQMFFKDWPLQIAIEALNDKRKKEQPEFIPLSIVVGRHTKGNANDPLSLSYTSLVDEIKTVLSGVGIKDTNIYRFKDKTNICGGAALAYIYSMMNTFPTIVIMPSIDELHGKFNISVGMWNQDSLFPLQKQMFSLDYDSNRMSLDREYMISKIQEIKMSYIALSTVMNDTYSLIESGKKLAFPEYAKHKSIPTYYPQIMSFALAEYQSLLMTFQSAVSANASSEEAFIIPLGPNALRRIEELLSKAIEELKS